MCSWGPIVLGHHHHPAVEAAARRQAALGDTLNGPAPVLVDLAELMVAMIPHADWCLFEKNGGDATTAAVTVARAGTGRKQAPRRPRQLPWRGARGAPPRSPA
jgi:glutamate-1-semialdehyde 2,1-aminomutase